MPKNTPSPFSPTLLQLLFFLFLSAGTCHAEGRIDSLSQIWNNPAEPDSSRFKALNAFYLDYAFAYPDSVLALTHFHYDLARQKGVRKEMAEALDNRALAYYVLGKPDSAISQLRNALGIVEAMNDSVGLARLYANMGNIHLSESAYQDAVRNYAMSLAIFKEKGMAFSQAEVLNNFGLVYYEIKWLDLALDYLNQALELYSKLGLQEKAGNIWLNIGAVHFEKGEYGLASTYFHKALEILMAHHNLSSVADGYYLLARVAQESGQVDSALHYIEKSLSINRNIGNEGQILVDQTLLASLIFQTDVNKATRMGEEILASAEGSSDHALRRDVYELLYKGYKKQERYSLALLMHEKYKTYDDSVQTEKNNLAIIREAIQSEVEFKLLKNQLEHEHIQAQLKLDQLKERYALILAGIILIGLILLYSRSRILTYRNQKAALLAEIERLKSSANPAAALPSEAFHLDRAKIEQAIDGKLNETDWKVLNILLEDPVISNQEIAERAFMSVDGIGSSLRRMYVAFDIKESKYKKISLIMEAIKISKG